MNSNEDIFARTLAIDPLYQGLAFAILERNRFLVDWGIARLWSNNADEALARVEDLIIRYDPDVLVLEDQETSFRGKGLSRIAPAIARLGLASGTSVRFVSFRDATAILGPEAATKHGRAVILARMFPETAHLVPPVRRPWMSEDRRINIFDALYLAVVVSGMDPELAEA